MKQTCLASVFPGGPLEKSHTCERLQCQVLAHVAQLNPEWTGEWAHRHLLPCSAPSAPYKDLHHMVIIMHSLLDQVNCFFHRGKHVHIELNWSQKVCALKVFFFYTLSHLYSFVFRKQLNSYFYWILFSPIPPGGKDAPPSHICCTLLGENLSKWQKKAAFICKSTKNNIIAFVFWKSPDTFFSLFCGISCVKLTSNRPPLLSLSTAWPMVPPGLVL